MSQRPSRKNPGTAPVTAGSRYRVHVLRAPEVDERGVLHGPPEARTLLSWGKVRCALAAEVGEPEGVRTIVFDLAVEVAGADSVAYRLDADPGEDARRVARIAEEALGPGCSTASIKSVATDGIPSRWYPDLEAFEEAALEMLC